MKSSEFNEDQSIDQIDNKKKWIFTLIIYYFFLSINNIINNLIVYNYILCIAHNQ